jgi:hypothetical protein
MHDVKVEHTAIPTNGAPAAEHPVLEFLAGGSPVHRRKKSRADIPQ